VNSRQGQQRVKGRRPHRHVVLVTDDQEFQLQELARVQNLTVARLLVDTTLGVKPPPSKVVATELAGLRRLFAGEATNLNQIARAANSGSYDSEAFDAALQTILSRDATVVSLYAQGGQR
jgi:hypothetical protein